MPVLIWKQLIEIKNHLCGSLILFFSMMIMIAMLHPDFNYFFVIPVALITIFMNSTRSYNLNIAFENIMASPMQIKDIVSQEAFFIFAKAYIISACPFVFLVLSDMKFMSGYNLLWALVNVMFDAIFCLKFALLSGYLSMILSQKPRFIYNSLSAMIFMIIFVVNNSFFELRCAIFLMIAFVFWIASNFLRDKLNRDMHFFMEGIK